MHTVLFHRRSTARTRTILNTALLLCGGLLGGIGAAPAANAETVPAANSATNGTAAVPATTRTAAAATRTRSWALLGPSRTIYLGQSAVVGAYTGARPASTAGIAVSLQRYTGRSWRGLMVRKTNQKGNAYFVVRPGATSLFRVVLAGNGRVAASTSPAVRIRVSGSRGLAVVAEAARHRGAPYRHGGAGPRAFDCSGFTQFVYKRFGRKLPHSATAQSRYGAGVTKRAAQPGDLVLFGRGGRYYHAAIYAGRGYMWDASTYGRPVSKRRIYSQSFVVRRVI